MFYKKEGYRSPQIRITDAPVHLQEAYKTLFTKDALDFVIDLILKFDDRVEQLQWSRLKRKAEFHLNGTLPTFPESHARSDPSWKISPLPSRLQNRHLDLGDVSPCNIAHFVKALNSSVQGVQVDFDDGHCPTWHNQILGFFNVYQAVHGELYNVAKIGTLPILMMRPRAWNMTEHNIIINGKKTPGPLIDFGFLMYHNARILHENECGPFFYLSKIEAASEAKLWNDIFVWAQRKLNLPHSTIKACVLIENILSAFEMDEILYELKDHSLGLNCGIWDYAASIIYKFGHNRKFLLPDRNKYVNVDKHFLKQYMLLVIKTCHARGAPATCGMSALLIKNSQNTSTIDKVKHMKKKEILMGADGFMVYDYKLVPYINKLWSKYSESPNQVSKQIDVTVTAYDLLEIPSGGVTLTGLKHNIEVAVLFIYNWLNGNGHFVHKECVEDSATAEISRLQIWQWIRHQVIIEDSVEIVDKELVQNLTDSFIHKYNKKNRKLQQAGKLFIEIVTMRYVADFITTYLNDHTIFQQTQFVLKYKL